MNVIGVYRERELAGKPESDDRILNLVGKELSGKRAKVELKGAEALTGKEKADLVFTMARTKDAHEKIRSIEKRGAIVVNKPDSVADSLNRELAYKKLSQEGAKIPKTVVKPFEKISAKDLYWKSVLKRADRHEHWFVINNEMEFANALEFYEKQGIKRMVVQEFVSGDHVKYYAIGKKVIFPKGTSSGIKEMEKQALIAGKALGLEVYGGDFIMAEEPFLVDVNDWPSFGSISGYSQEEAAKEIARYLLEKVKKKR
jgi:glutathione synthase/RimK-type ligase-like ATP-grasp enzyme